MLGRLFGRRSGEPRTEHNRAAFAWEDGDDAKRGQPSWDAQGYASERGLEFRGSGAFVGFRGVMPLSDDLIYNAMRGRLPGGQPGILLHELVLLSADRGSIAGVGGSFYHLSIATENFRFFSLKPEDIVKDWIDSHDPTGLLIDPDPTPPARAPVTTAATHGPEVLGLFPRVRIDRRRQWGGQNFDHEVKLEQFGLPGWWWRSEPAVGDDVVASIVGGPAGDWLRAAGKPGLLQVLCREGELAVRRNGFLDAAGMDELAEGLGVLAGAFRTAGLAQADPQPWETELPPPRWLTQYEWEPGGYDPTLRFREAVLALAQHLGATLEDPRAYHRAFPELPVPGTAFAVLRRTDGTRLVLHNERDILRVHIGPTAIVSPAPPGAAPTDYPQRAGDNVFRSVRGSLHATMRTRGFAYEGSTAGLGQALIADVERFLADAEPLHRAAGTG